MEYKIRTTAYHLTRPRTAGSTRQQNISPFPHLLLTYRTVIAIFNTIGFTWFPGTSLSSEYQLQVL